MVMKVTRVQMKTVVNSRGFAMIPHVSTLTSVDSSFNSSFNNNDVLLVLVQQSPRGDLGQTLGLDSNPPRYAQLICPLL